MIERGQSLQLCADLRRLLQRTLGPAVTRLLDTLDGQLFERASSARAGGEEQRYFDALRELRRQRIGVEHGFIARLGNDLIPEHLAERRHPQRVPLSLFPRDELEEKLALSSAASAACTRLHGPLYGLNRRLEVLLGRSPIDDQTNPIGPAALAEGFRDAFMALDVDTELRLLAYRQLGGSLFDRLASCYEACNLLLIEAGVLPDLPVEPALAPLNPADKAGSAAPGSIDPPEAAGAIAGPGPEADSTRDQESGQGDDLATLYRRLLARRLGGAGDRRAAADRPPGDPTNALPRERLIDAVARLLKEPHGDPDALKARLVELASGQPAGSAALSPEDEGTVDMVHALFQRMGQDSLLPKPLNRALEALRVPFLHAALRDQALMSDPEHPARRLIDEFGDSARGWCASADPGERLLRQMKTLQGLLRERAGSDAAGFRDALQEFREFAANQRMQAEQAELRAIESTRSRESLHQAQIDARLVLESRMGGFSPSLWLRHLLLRHWSAYVVLVMLRYGLVSDHYRHAIAFADALLVGERDSANPIHAASFRARRLELETQLRQGLATLAYSDEEIVRLCGELHAFILAGASQRRVAFAQLEEEPDLGLQDQPRPESLDPASMRHLRGLRPGTWFELAHEEDESERGKLCWISPLSGRWMLVNWAGRKVADLPPERMAEDIARGLARVIGDANLLRRAIDAVMDELQQGAGEGPDVQAGV